MRTRALSSLAVLLAAASALSGCGADDSDAKAGAGSDVGRIQDYGPIELDGVTHIGDVTLPALDDQDLTPLTVGVTSGGYVRTSSGSVPLTHAELFSSEGKLEREFATSGAALTDPDAGTAAWVEVVKGRHTLVLTDLVGGRELGRWGIADDSLLTAVWGQEAAVMTDDGSVLFRAGQRRPSRPASLGEEWVVLDLDDGQFLATDFEESVTIFDRDGAEIGTAKGVHSAVLSPDGARMAGFREKDEFQNEAVLATVEGELGQIQVDRGEPHGVAWIDADTIVVDTGAPDTDDDVDSDFRRHLCQVGSGDCQEVPIPEGVRWVGFLMPNDARAALLTLGS